MTLGRYRIRLLLRTLERGRYRGGGPGPFARSLDRGRTLVGRRAGRTPTFLLVMVVLDGERYLVPILVRDVAWARWLKPAAGHAVLRHRRAEEVRLEALEIERRASVLGA